MYPDSTIFTKMKPGNSQMIELLKPEILLSIEKPINIREANRNVKVKSIDNVLGPDINNNYNLPLIISDTKSKRRESASRKSPMKNIRNHKRKKSGYENLRRSRSLSNLNQKDREKESHKNISPILSKRNRPSDNNTIPTIEFTPDSFLQM